MWRYGPYQPGKNGTGSAPGLIMHLTEVSHLPLKQVFVTLPDPGNSLTTSPSGTPCPVNVNFRSLVRVWRLAEPACPTVSFCSCRGSSSCSCSLNSRVREVRQDRGFSNRGPLSTHCVSFSIPPYSSIHTCSCCTLGGSWLMKTRTPLGGSSIVTEVRAVQ